MHEACRLRSKSPEFGRNRAKLGQNTSQLWSNRQDSRPLRPWDGHISRNDLKCQRKRLEVGKRQNSEHPRTSSVPICPDPDPDCPSSRACGAGSPTRTSSACDAGVSLEGRLCESLRQEVKSRDPPPQSWQWSFTAESSTSCALPGRGELYRLGRTERAAASSSGLPWLHDCSHMAGLRVADPLWGCLHGIALPRTPQQPVEPSLDLPSHGRRAAALRVHTTHLRGSPGDFRAKSSC